MQLFSTKFPTHSLRVLLAAALVIAPGAPGWADNINLPDLGDASAAAVSPAQERKLGEDFMRQARRSLAFLDDPEVNTYLQALGARITSNTEAAGREFRFFAINDPSINAFAVPGGFIGVHSGLFLAADSEAELASVLAHEVAHISQRHIPRLIAESQRVSVPAMAAILASILIAGSGKSGGEAGIALTSAALQQHGINYTRTFEEEADRIGMGLLAKSGFDPHGMPAFFERMQNLNRYNDSSLPEFLRTHPITTNRIADARNRATQYAVQPAPDSLDFHHVRARLRALTAPDAAAAVRDFRANLSQGKFRNSDAERYGLAVALLRTKELDAARVEASALVARRPARVSYHVLRAEIELAAGKRQDALTIYRDTHKHYPDDRLLQRHYGTALLRAGEPRKAYEFLKPVVRHEPDDPAVHKLFGTAAGEIGERTEAHRALAEYHYLSGNPGAAIQQLQIAARHAGGDFYVLSSIEARIAAIRETLPAPEKPR